MTDKGSRKRGPKRPDKPGPKSLPAAQQARVRKAMAALWKEHGSDDKVTTVVAVSSVTVYRVRSGVCAPGRKVAAAVAAALGVDVAALLDGSARVGASS